MNSKKTYSIKINYNPQLLDYKLLKFDLYDYILNNEDEKLSKIINKYHKSVKDILIESQQENGNIFHYILLKNISKYSKKNYIEKIIKILNNHHLITDFLNVKDQFGNYPLAYAVKQKDKEIYNLFTKYLTKENIIKQIYEKNKLDMNMIDIYNEPSVSESLLNKKEFAKIFKYKNIEL